MKAILSHLRSPAMLVACVSLVVALGGVSYAAGVLPKNSVGTTQLKKKAVTASKLRAGSVSGAKVRNGTLMATDFRAGQIPAGPQGPKGDKGDAGAPGVSAYEIVHLTAGMFNPGSLVHSQVDCGARDSTRHAADPLPRPSLPPGPKGDGLWTLL